jgi:SAM-dependent methyltransferase
MSYRLLRATASLLRRAHLLGLADSALYIQSVLQERRANAQFRRQRAGFPVPPAHLAFDAYGNVNNAAYVESGELDARTVAEVINQQLAAKSIRVCEWGCGPGRVIRHLRRFLQHPGVELYGTDYNGESIDWCRGHLAGIAFRTNGLSPPLPFDDGFFDCVYGISVLTHLSEAKHIEWIGELKRLIRPGGVVILTTHGDASAGRLLEAERKRYARGEIVVRGEVKEGKKWYLAYQPPAFMRGKLLAGLQVVSHARISDTQDLWVAKK